MKSFKQYITESISSHVDQIRDVLVGAAQEHGFDPRDLQRHRSLGTHNRLLTINGRIPIYHSVGGTPETISGRSNRYSFKIPGLDKKHNPEVYMTVNTTRERGHLSHGVDFLFGEAHAMHPTLLPHERSDIMNHVFGGVMRSLAHFTIADHIDPNRDKFHFDPYGESSSESTKKTRLYKNMMDSLMTLHGQLGSR
jgi:hypothetical protein